MYNLLVITAVTRFAAPVADEREVRGYIADSLSASDIPLPDSLALGKFEASLAETGEYYYEDVLNRVHVEVTRSR